MPYTPGRRILVLTHTGREDAISAALQATRMFAEEGLVSVMLEQDVAAIRAAAGDPPEFAPEALGVDCELEDITLGLVLGGDGSVLRAADFVRGYNVPLLAVNLGHVGFLAESERTDLHRTVQAIASESYVVIERMALDVVVHVEGREVARTWALNEASVEKSHRERMLVLWCDGRRTVELPPQARIEVSRSAEPVRLARLNPTPFAERLVRKFRLPTDGWRGPVTAQERAGVLHAVETVEPRHAGPRPDVVEPATMPLSVLSPADIQRHRDRGARHPGEDA